MPQPSTVDLSIRLLRNGTKISQALKTDHSLTSYPCSVGELFIATSYASPPGWTDFFEAQAVGIKAKLMTQQASAVLFLYSKCATSPRLFVICFGQGHHSIDNDKIERQFGLRVVLNIVSRNALRTLDSASLDSTIIQKRTQASRDSDLFDFGIDTQRDLLRLASGRPSDPNLAKAATGKDVLNIKKKINILDLPNFCTDLLAMYKSIDYKKDFGFIDHIIPIHDKSLENSLDNHLISEIKNLISGKDSILHISIPDIVNPGDAMEFAYYGSNLARTKKKRYSTLEIEDYIEEIKLGNPSKINNIDNIKSHEIRTIRDDKNIVQTSIRIYNCIVFEVNVRGSNYVIFDGQWFRIDSGYAAEIEVFFNKVNKPAFIKSTTKANEEELISDLCHSSYSDLLCLDRTKISPAGMRGGNFEPCDFLSLKGELIHLKDGNSSAPLSHLWSQGVVSAESLVRDSKFRKDYKTRIKEREKIYSRSGFQALAPGLAKIDPSKYTIVFAVMRKRYIRNKQIGLPFFSKVALRAAVDRLTTMGFETELHLIEKV